MLLNYKGINFNSLGNLRFELNKIFGIGYQKSSYICDLVGISKNLNIFFLSFFFFEMICNFLKIYYILDYRLRDLIEQRMIFFLNLKLIKGIRFSRGLPIRGQRTHSNGKQQKYHKRNKI